MIIAVIMQRKQKQQQQRTNKQKTKQNNKKESETPRCFETIFSTDVHRSACKTQLTTLGSLEYYSTWLSNILRHDLISNGNRTDLVFHSHGPTKRPFHIFQLPNLASYLCAPIFLRFFLWFCIASSFRAVLCKAKERGFSVLLIICVLSPPLANLPSKSKLDRKPMNHAQRVEKLD